MYVKYNVNYRLSVLSILERSLYSLFTLVKIDVEKKCGFIFYSIRTSKDQDNQKTSTTIYIYL